MKRPATSTPQSAESQRQKSISKYLGSILGIMRALDSSNEVLSSEDGVGKIYEIWILARIKKALHAVKNLDGSPSLNVDIVQGDGTASGYFIYRGSPGRGTVTQSSDLRPSHLRVSLRGRGAAFIEIHNSQRWDLSTSRAAHEADLGATLDGFLSIVIECKWRSYKAIGIAEARNACGMAMDLEFGNYYLISTLAITESVGGIFEVFNEGGMRFRPRPEIQLRTRLVALPFVNINPDSSADRYFDALASSVERKLLAQIERSSSEV